jgi:DNA helicase-2/ATP-dependent DNA helicase PcrA
LKLIIVGELDEDSKLNGLSYENPSQLILEELINWLKSGKVPLSKNAEIAYYFLNNIPECLDYMLAKYKYLFIDEYQDCSQIQHSIFDLLTSRGMIGFCVGDSKQSIYGYAKKSPQYLMELTSDKRFKHFELSANMRSHQSIVDYSTRLLDKHHIISRYPIDENRVIKISVDGDESVIMSGIAKSLEKIKKRYEVKRNNKVALLCRKNSTVERLAKYCKIPCKAHLSSPFDSIKNRNRTIDLLSRILFAYYEYHAELLTVIEFCDDFFELSDNERRKLKGIVSKIFSIDELELSNHMDDFQSYLSLVDDKKLTTYQMSFLKTILCDIEKLDYFKPTRDNEVQIMSLHKAKGLEFDIIFIFDSYKYILPSEWGNEYQHYEEDLRLHYVALTRASKACYIMQGNLRYREKQDDLVLARDSIFLSINGLPSHRRDLIWSKQMIK